ncbi:MAG TPA: nuclear transport factor 2 family protein [Candidatus Solibacter sp.]|nr:nuclear transport factor 2 family protein [Candidatus Solibacter sp.]
MYRPYTSSLADSRPFQDVESLLRGLTQDFSMAFNTGNYDQAAALFAHDGVFMAPLQEPAYGQKPVERMLRDLGEAGYSDLRLETTRVEHSGDMAMELGRYTVVVRAANGTLVPERGKYVKVWRRLGAWLIIADSWSRAPQVASDRAA